MKERPYRCQNPACSTDPGGRLIFDFWATAPVCPKCGSNASRGTVIQLEIIHFDPPTDVAGIGKNVLACNPSKPVYGRRASGYSPAVNCRECRATDVWIKDMAEQESLEVGV